MTKEERKKKYDKEWREANKEWIKEYRDKYNKEHKEQTKKASRDWYLTNLEKAKEARDRFKLNNPNYHSDNFKNNSEYYIEHARQWRASNQQHVKDQHSRYVKHRRAVDPAYKLINNLRVRHRSVLKGVASTTKGLGCDSKFFRDYLSSLWTEGMCWDNYGFGKDKWNIDHIQPLSLYYTQPELLPQLIHYSNMQPMWQPENQKKSNKVA